MKSPLVSIVMPVKNEESFLRDCLDSILAQGYIHWELLAVDDHSEDNTWQILQEYAKNDPRIKIFRNRDRGIISALRLAYLNSQGKYITRMDADDLMSSDKIGTLCSTLQKAISPSLATAKVRYFAANGVKDGYLKYQQWLNGLCDHGNHYTQIYRECVIPSPCWMVDRTVLDSVGAFSSNKYPEDYDLTFRFYLNDIPVISSNKILHHWRDYTARTSRTSPDYSDNRFLDIKTHYFLLKDYDPDKTLILWGAGKKGKMIARLLQDKKVPFRWISNNVKKIGKSIYDVIVESESPTPSEENQIILAIANPIEQGEIIDRLKANSLHLGTSIFPFC